MKFFVGILFLFAFVSNAYCAEPVIKVRVIPNDNVLEFYEDSEELFAIKLLEYYDAAVALRTQIQLMGALPKTKFRQPTFEELSDQDLDIIKLYYKIAKRLEKEVLALPEAFSNRQIDFLRNELVEQRMKYDSLYFEEMDEYLSAKHSDYFKNQLNDAIKRNVELTFQIDSLQLSYFEKLDEQKERLSKMYNDYYSNTYPAVSISASGNKFMMQNDNLSTKLSVSTEFLLNLSPLFNFGKYVDVWFKYTLPVVNTEFEIIDYPNTQKIEYKWDNDIYSIGLNGNIPYLIETDDFKIGFKFGLGQFWGKGTMPNIGTNDIKYDGQLLKFEFNFGKKSVYTPFELFLNYSAYFNSNDVIFITPHGTVDFGNATLCSIGLGLRISLIRTDLID